MTLTTIYGFRIIYYCVRITWQYNPRIVFLGSTYIISSHLKCKIIRYMGFILKKTQPCYKKITREYRLVRDFNFITRYEVSQSVLLRCTRTDTLVDNRNIFSNLSALVSQTLWVCAGILLGSRSHLKYFWRFYQGEESIAPVDSWLLWHNRILDKFTQNVRS